MNLPIIQSILNGALRPNFRYKEIGTNTIHSQSVKLEENLPYTKLAREFAILPNKLRELEELCEKKLANYVQFEFSNERPICISDIAPDTYTPIIEYAYPPNIEYNSIAYINQEVAEQLAIDTPCNKFYNAIILAEAKRIKLALINFANVSRSNIDTRSAIKDTLNQLLSYSKITLYATDIDLKEPETPTFIEDNTIFLLLRAHLIKCYYEIILLFDAILTEKDYTPFDDFIFQCYNAYPTPEQTSAYQSAKLIQQAQQAIATNQAVAENTNLLAQLYETLKSNPSAEPLRTVTIAIENFIFIQSTQKPIPTLEQILKSNYSKSILRETKRDINEKLLPLSNPREMQLALEEIRDELVEIPTTLQLNTIFQQLNKWLIEQEAICRKNISQSFMPVATPSITSAKLKPRQSQTNINELKTKAHKTLNFMSGVNLKNDKIMPDTDYIRLLEYVDSLISTGEVPEDIKQIRTTITIEYIRYTFYLIYKNLNIKTPTRMQWVEFVHKVFSQFDNTETDTTSKKFTTKPNMYDDDIKEFIKNIE